MARRPVAPYPGPGDTTGEPRRRHGVGGAMNPSPEDRYRIAEGRDGLHWTGSRAEVRPALGLSRFVALSGSALFAAALAAMAYA